MELRQTYSVLQMSTEPGPREHTMVDTQLLNLHATIFRLPDAYFLLGVVMFHFSLQWHSCSKVENSSLPGLEPMVAGR